MTRSSSLNQKVVREKRGEIDKKIRKNLLFRRTITMSKIKKSQKMIGEIYDSQLHINLSNLKLNCI
jgi:hypothetical protein